MKLKRLPLLSKIKTPSPKKRRRLITLLLSGVYAIICGIIIIPQIDHQEWYPSQLRTTDLPASMDFSSHREVAVPLDSVTYTETQMRDTLQLIAKRASLADLSEFTIEKNADNLLFRFPKAVSDTTITSILSPGVIEFSTPKADVDFETNPVEMFNSDNFEPSSLAIDGITDTIITNSNEQYTYIELRTTPETKSDWEAFAQSSAQSNIGLSIDGVMNPAWMIPPDGTNTTEVTLVISSQVQGTEIMLSYINDGPLPVELSDIIPTETEATYTSETLTYLYILVVGIAIVGIILRKFYLKENLLNITATVLIIAGSAAVLKFTGIPVSILFLLTFMFLSTAILLTPRPSQVFIFILMFLLGFTLKAFGSANLQIMGRTSEIIAIYGIISIFFYEFTNIYEEK